MSYIRSTSNPEGLYIYGSCDDEIWIHHDVKPPLSSGGDYKIVVPEEAFTSACRRWCREYAYHSRKLIEVDGFSIQRNRIFLKNGHLVPEKFDFLFPNKFIKFLYRILAKKASRKYLRDYPNRKRTLGQWLYFSVLYPHLRRKYDAASLIKLSYEGNFVYLWAVTWKYVINRFECERCEDEREEA